MINNDEEINRRILFYVCRIYLFLRNTAWVLGIVFIIYFLLFRNCEASLWPTPVPCPTEIHIVTGEEMAEDYYRDQQNQSIERELERREEQRRRQREIDERVRIEKEKQDKEEYERLYQEWVNRH